MRSSRRALALNLTLGAVLLAAALAAYLALRPATATPAQTRTVAAARATVTAAVTAAGSVQSANTVAANFGAAGTVKQVLVKVGAKVAKGQALAKLDLVPLQGKVNEAADSLEAAQQGLTAAQNAPNGADPVTVAQRRSQLTQAGTALATAKANLAAGTLTAPADGTVISLGGAAGTQVGSGSGSAGTEPSGFVVLSDLSDFQVRATLAEIDVAKVKAEQTAEITVNALPEQPFTAKVTQVDLTPASTQNVVQYGATLVLDGKPEGLKPGQSASVRIEVARAENVLAVPSYTVQNGRVTVLTGGQPVARAVQVGVRGEALTEITGGLAEGEQVVVPTAQGGTQQGGAGGFGGGGRGGGAVLPGGGSGGRGAVPGGGGGAGGAGGTGAGGAGGSGGTGGTGAGGTGSSAGGTGGSAGGAGGSAGGSGAGGTGGGGTGSGAGAGR